MRDTQKRSLRYFCSCNREISVGNMLCRTVYRQKEVCVFLCYSFVLVFTDSELFKVKLFPKCNTPGRALSNQTSSDVVTHTGLHRGAALHGQLGGNRAIFPHRFPLCMLYSIMLPAEAHRAQYQGTMDHSKHGMLRILVLLIGTTWRGTESKHMQRAAKSHTQHTS